MDTNHTLCSLASLTDIRLGLQQQEAQAPEVDCSGKQPGATRMHASSRHECAKPALACKADLDFMEQSCHPNMQLPSKATRP